VADYDIMVGIATCSYTGVCVHVTQNIARSLPYTCMYMILSNLIRDAG